MAEKKMKIRLQRKTKASSDYENSLLLLLRKIVSVHWFKPFHVDIAHHNSSYSSS